MKANFTILSALVALLLTPAFANAQLFSSDLTTSAGFHFNATVANTADTGNRILATITVPLVSRKIAVVILLHLRL